MQTVVIVGTETVINHDLKVNCRRPTSSYEYNAHQKYDVLKGFAFDELSDRAQLSDFFGYFGYFDYFELEK